MQLLSTQVSIAWFDNNNFEPVEIRGWIVGRENVYTLS